MSTLIDAARVNAIFTDCLFRDEEIVDGKPIVEPVVAEGIRASYGFHPTRLDGYRAEVAGVLGNLPPSFFPDTGGGWSFLMACDDRDGVQWGDHPNMEQLFALGIALNMARWQLPREMWDILPGGMPYIVVDPKGLPPKVEV